MRWLFTARQQGSPQEPRAEHCSASVRGGHHSGWRRAPTGSQGCHRVWWLRQSSAPVSHCVKTNPQMRKHLMSAAGARAWCGVDGEVLMAEAREQPGPMPCWHRAPGRTCAGHRGTGGWAGCPMGWHRPAVLQGSRRAWGQCCRVLGLGMGSVALIPLESSPRFEWDAKGAVC